MTEADTCVVCRRREAPVCRPCRVDMAGQLAALPDLLDRLNVALIPGPGGGERVSSSREAPTPVRLAALTLTAGGSDQARCAFVPKTRVWSTAVEVAAAGGATTTVTVWHREPVRDDLGRPVMALVDDQTGVLPIKPWLAAWAADWRGQFGHAQDRPAVTAAPIDPPPATTTAGRARTLLGLGAALLPGQRPDDPVAEEWTLRWRPGAHRHHATLGHHSYLVTWLVHACDNHPHIADFAVSLRMLVGAARAALGDTDNLAYLGRCPETTPVGVCGALLWHDPHASKVICPRCRAETDQRHLIWLARRILDTWPVDPRRRYPRGLIEVLQLPLCGCGVPVTVEWIDATERSDGERFWRPGRVTCSEGCERAGAA